MQTVRFTIRPDNKRHAMRMVWDNLDGWMQNGNGALELCVRPLKSRRSLEQNRRLWKIYGVLAEQAWVNGRRFDAETWHEYCKGLFLGFNVYAMPDGTERKTPISTATLNTAEAAEYQNNIQSWAAGEFGILWDF